MTINCKIFILIFSIFLALSSSAIKMAAAGSRRHHHHRRHHLRSRETVQFKPSIPTVPFSIPWTVPAVYNVSWNFNVKGWPHGKFTFHPGDILVFNYDQDLHNVVPVDEANYFNCSIPEVATIYNSGHDAIVLRPGVNYFICGTMGHCIAGMLIDVNAT